MTLINNNSNLAQQKTKRVLQHNVPKNASRVEMQMAKSKIISRLFEVYQDNQSEILH